MTDPAEQPRRRSALCPICGDGARHALWIDPEPPPGCPDDDSAMRGGPHTIRSVTECPYMMAKARQRTHWRKTCPEAFDSNGNILPGQPAYVLERCMRPGEELVL